MDIKYFVKPNGNLNISSFADFARENDYGLEISTFAKAKNIDMPNLPKLIEQYKNDIKGISKVTTHGVFADMFIVAQDARVRQLAYDRIMQNVDIAKKLGANYIVFHPNFNPLLRHHYKAIYNESWVSIQSRFWKKIATEAKEANIKIFLENAWEHSPKIIKEVIDSTGMDNVKACLDVGHVNVFTRSRIDEWVKEYGDYCEYLHFSDNYGTYCYDEHLVIGKGKIDWKEVHDSLEKNEKNLRTNGKTYNVCLELYQDELQPTIDSIDFLRKVGFNGYKREN